jgi:hypothetical protein
VVLFNTGAGLKYVDATATAMKLVKPAADTGETDHRGIRLPVRQLVGGIITPV